jgi:hypothetical protein
MRRRVGALANILHHIAKCAASPLIERDLLLAGQDFLGRRARRERIK